MFQQPIDSKNYGQLERLVSDSSKIVITCHVKPDGDAIGSTLALWHILGLLGKDVFVITPDSPPEYLRFLPGFKEITAFSINEDFARQLIEEASLIFCLDFNAAYRVDRMADALREAPAKKVMIDHHLDPEDFVDVVISQPQDSSTCFLLFKVFCQMGWRQLINKDVASCLSAGMMTDTGNFSYNANDPELYNAMAELLFTGIDKVLIWEKLNVKSENQLRLNGYAIDEKMELFADSRASLIQITSEELQRYSYRKGDLEGLVNVPLQIPSVKISMLMHQEPGFVKVSMRSQGNIYVNKICEKYFGGGGHKNAAGGEFRGTMEEAREVYITALKELYTF